MNKQQLESARLFPYHAGDEWHGDDGFWRRILSVENGRIRWWGVGIKGQSECSKKTFGSWVMAYNAWLKEPRK